MIYSKGILTCKAAVLEVAFHRINLQAYYFIFDTQTLYNSFNNRVIKKSTSKFFFLLTIFHQMKQY